MSHPACDDGGPNTLLGCCYAEMNQSFDWEGLESIAAWVERLVVQTLVVSALSCFTSGSSVTVVVGAAGGYTVSEL